MRSAISLTFVAVAATGLSLVSANPEPTQMAGMVRRHRHHEISQRGVLEELNESHLVKRQTYHGSATYYNVQTGNAGACGSYLSASDYVVALAQPLWGNLNVQSPLCGHTITISANGKSTQATIMDACPTGGGNCGGPDLDMSQSLFEFFNPTSVGKFSITWSLGGGGGGGGGHHSSGSGSSSNDNSDNSDNSGDDEAASSSAAAAAAKSKAAQSSADAKSSSLASKSSASAASASRSSASVASVASVSSASHYSVTKAAAMSSASVASVASSKSKASKIAASKASKAAQKSNNSVWQAAQATPHNLQAMQKALNGISNMVQGAHQ